MQVCRYAGMQVCRYAGRVSLRSTHVYTCTYIFPHSRRVYRVSSIVIEGCIYIHTNGYRYRYHTIMTILACSHVYRCIGKNAGKSFIRTPLRLPCPCRMSKSKGLRIPRSATTYSRRNTNPIHFYESWMKSTWGLIISIANAINCMNFGGDFMGRDMYETDLSIPIYPHMD
jgi:hypothetical protein